MRHFEDADVLTGGKRGGLGLKPGLYSAQHVLLDGVLIYFTRYPLPNNHPRLRHNCTNLARAGKQPDLGNIIGTIVHLVNTTHASVTLRVRPLAIITDTSNGLAGDSGQDTTAGRSRTGEVVAEAALDMVSTLIETVGTVYAHEEGHTR